MDISGSLAAELKTLTDALGRPSTDLTDSVRKLADGLRFAVPSWLGLTLTLVLNGLPLALTVLDDGMTPRRIATSAAMPLTPVHGAEHGSSIVFYAGTSGAFVDFAADAAYALGLELDDVALDQHLTPASRTSGVTGLADIAGLNQAIGILVDHGHTPDEAQAELRRLARHARTSLSATAQLVIHSASQHSRPGAL
ncbi:ANTAR domain-containing protein [Kitasatospora mediocidica]|uniref:ANTAR domain-containing protein n=1 Tax=Kitasatospora mediocidica TaxID=58352 RepID=UPI00055B9DF4|nr:ANTAR domain-containing protein [Kitasatospora mediocidica]